MLVLLWGGFGGHNHDPAFATRLLDLLMLRFLESLVLLPSPSTLSCLLFNISYESSPPSHHLRIKQTVLWHAPVAIQSFVV